MLKNNINQATKGIFSIVLFLLLVFPMYYSLVPGEDRTGVWEPVYLLNFEDFIFTLIVIPIYPLWLSFIFVRHKTIKWFTSFFLFLHTAFLSFLMFMTGAMPIQDFSPGIGFLLLIAIFPLFLIVLIIDKFFPSKNDLSIVFETILDDDNLEDETK